MASAIDDEDLSISISNSNVRRHPAHSQRTPAPEDARRHYDPRPPRSNNAELARTSQRLGQYKIQKTLGEGSFGKVKLAIHEVTGEMVALKIINRRKLVTRDMAGRIEREIQYLQLLRHPHIIKLYDKARPEEYSTDAISVSQL